MIITFLVFVLLTIMIGSITIAMRRSDASMRRKVLGKLMFTSLCASAALVVLCVITLIF